MESAAASFSKTHADTQPKSSSQRARPQDKNSVTFAKRRSRRDGAGADVPAQTITFDPGGDLDGSGDTEMILDVVKALVGAEKSVQSL